MKGLMGGAQHVLNLSHYMESKGIAFHVDYATTDLTTGSYLYMRIVTGSEYCVHGIFSVAVGGSSIVRLFEDGTVTAAGTTQTAYCFNRQTEGTNSMTAFINTAAQITTTGTQIGVEYIPGGTGVGQTNFGGSIDGRFNTIFDTSSTYLLSVYNESAATITANITMSFHTKPGGAV